MYVKVKVTTNSKKELVEKVSLDHYVIKVTEKAEMNRANGRILEIMRNEYKTRNIRIVSGHHSPSKILSVDHEDDSRV